jgi:hypothetical protein
LPLPFWLSFRAQRRNLLLSTAAGIATTITTPFSDRSDRFPQKDKNPTRVTPSWVSIGNQTTSENLPAVAVVMTVVAVPVMMVSNADHYLRTCRRGQRNEKQQGEQTKRKFLHICL